MPKKKGKKSDDDWEEDAAAIAQEVSVVVEKAVKESRIDALFADAIARGKATDAEFDRATDELASGAKSEDEIIAFYFPNTALDEDEKLSKKDKKSRGSWRDDRDGRAGSMVDAAAAGEDDLDEAAVAAQAAAMAQLHVELFGAPGSPHALDLGGVASGSEIERVYQSELQLDEWRRAAADTPKTLALPNMTALALFGSYGVSTHAGCLVRLWDAASGRRLAAHQLKSELTACTASGEGIVVVGDAVGALHVYTTEADFVPLRVPPPRDSVGAVVSLALLPLFSTGGSSGGGVSGCASGRKGSGSGGGGGSEGGTSSMVLVASSEDGSLTASLASVQPWPPSHMPRVHLPVAAPSGGDECAGGQAWGGKGCGPMSLAAGPYGCFFGAAGGHVAMYDLAAGAAAWVSSAIPAPTAWPTPTSSGGVRAGWTAAWQPDGLESLVAGVGALGAGPNGGRGLPSPPPPPPPKAGGAAAVAPAASDPPSGGAVVGSTAPAPSRRLSYSPFWQLLAAAEGDGASGAVALWDIRQPGSRGPAAALAIAGGASWVHLDEGTHGLSGHLLVAPSGGGEVRLYDVRRVPCARAAAAVRPIGVLPAPPHASPACFAAAGSTLVVGGGAKCGEALRYCGERGDIGEGEADEDEDEERRRPKKEKKKRIEKKEVRGSRQSRCA